MAKTLKDEFPWKNVEQFKKEVTAVKNLDSVTVKKIYFQMYKDIVDRGYDKITALKLALNQHAKRGKK